MNKYYRKKYQNVVEKKNHLAVASKDHNTIDSLESQALDGFYVESSRPEFYMQRMGQIFIKTSGKKRYNMQFFKNKTSMIFPGIKKKFPAITQALDNFIIKPKEKPKNIVQKPVHFNILQKGKRKIFKEEQLDSFICDKKERPILRLQNVHNIIVEKKKKLDYILQSLNHLKLPATGKFFNNNPKLKLMNIYELEYLKIKAPLKCINSSTLLIPLQPKKTKFTDMASQNSSNLNYIINKVKIFNPSLTSIKNESSLLITQQPKKTSFVEITPNKESNIIYTSIIPKKITFNDITIDNSIPDVFLQEQPKKRYYSAMNAENMTIHASERPDFCLEIDPNEEIFIPNVYDMLLIQNYWDDLSVKSFRVCLRPKGYIGKSSQNLEIMSDTKLNNLYEHLKSKEVIKENEKEENSQDHDEDILKDFNENHENKPIEKKIDDNLYENKESKDDNKAVINNKEKNKDKPPKYSFKDLKKKLMMLQDDDE